MPKIFNPTPHLQIFTRQQFMQAVSARKFRKLPDAITSMHVANLYRYGTIGGARVCFSKSLGPSEWLKGGQLYRSSFQIRNNAHKVPPENETIVAGKKAKVDAHAPKENDTIQLPAGDAQIRPTESEEDIRADRAEDPLRTKTTIPAESATRKREGTEKAEVNISNNRK
ncbi:hypothetical protein BKA67DRAFT_556706 [Truncatella angustata]|uniref:Uncharacterized protein n=1 Tax=Truncatella angustata TaxID=152316 RepID=A0A9P8UTF1_9PEZI|nr:uncharacterized protein BKA67DRAFT_556706 [Truncatella angustata]KAH6657908.1 hypothetical protein BKA67DRAFT_556706 [Truncatella angustata]KAH8197752.1 hypothetical protein TruAng_008086 [Truncatella angustata]